MGRAANPFSHCRAPIKGVRKRSRDHAFCPTSLRTIHFSLLSTEWNSYKWLPLDHSPSHALPQIGLYSKNGRENVPDDEQENLKGVIEQQKHSSYKSGLLKLL
ncbi:hypothetical protein AVEN_42224-1 [Araneus ventricosus]|uniref:Uncharacterized protein n=1 Tax=Araneus ventricosus TaxID=182803 RepID=A0A4Y2AY22_ARAVE|nr:hypothetical protein AVEN_42224-1 [Araneus ventricosus]